MVGFSGSVPIHAGRFLKKILSAIQESVDW